MTARVPVKPRVYSQETGERLPLEHEIRTWLAAGARGAVRLIGPPGSGKTRALEYLASVISVDANLRCLDDPSESALDDAAERGLAVYAGDISCGGRRLALYRIAPWGDDELVEYLLGMHKPRCPSVMGRVKTMRDRGALQGNPELWAAVLDEMAGDDGLAEPGAALRRFVESHCPSRRVRSRIADICLYHLTQHDDSPAAPSGAIDGAGAEVRGLIRHRYVRMLLAADRVAQHLRSQSSHLYLRRQLAREFVREIAQRAASSRRALAGLRRILAGGDRSIHPMTASILHASNTGWRPGRGCVPCLAGAYLERAVWPGVGLAGADVSRADFERSDLNRGDLRRARARQACFRGANLRGLSMKAIDAAGANFAGADLRDVFADWASLENADLTHANLRVAVLKGASLVRANLTEASFVGADLSRADLSDARLTDADFSNACLDSACLAKLDLTQVELSGASLNGTNMTGCNLQGVSLPEADFEGANLTGADMTGSRLPDACLSDADLRETGLADIDWERADLRHTDLRGSTFHAGSSRSGLVFSPIASEGTRTGFYTDEFGEQSYKAAEEIRKANLRAADLRGAHIDGVDFYLVDLREALYDADQEQHFRRCGAILESPV